LDKITVVTDGKNILTTDVLDAEGNHILRVQEVHVFFEVTEMRPHGYFTRILQNEDGSTQVELDEHGEAQPVYLTEDVDFIEIQFKEE
jgi:hypothetical protein